MKRFVYIVFVAAAWGCARDVATEKRQGSRNKVVDVHDKVKKIPLGDVLLSNAIWPYILDDYLIVEDLKSPDEILHFFNTHTFDYVTSAAYMGQGPGEIARAGHIGVDEARRTLYVADHGKRKVFSYPLDSALSNPAYVPEVKLKLEEREFPSRYQYIGDTLCIGVVIQPAGSSSFTAATGKWNMLTGGIELMPYEHPEIKRRRISVSASPAHGLYVECYHHHDLMTIGTLDGALKYNVYGPKWDNKTTNRVAFYRGVIFCGDRIVASSLEGGANFVTDQTGTVRGTYATRLLVFDLDGNYLQTLDTGYDIYDICYDKANHRLILTFDDELQLAYLDLGRVL